jgi:phospholipid/cholesterol/gamma-HCH transport system substrate-binding protein
MAISSAKKIKTGLLVVVSIVLAVLLIIVIGNNRKLFGSSFTVYANFKNIAGTREGNFVRFAGINVGTVDEINLIDDSTVQLRLSLDKKIQKHIKRNAVATIGSDGLMGDKLITIRAGDATSGLPPVNNGETIKGVDPIDSDKLLNNLSRITTNGDSITTGLAVIINKINNGNGLFGRMLSDERFAKKLEGTIEKASETVGTIKKTAASVNDNMEAAKHSFLLKGYFRRKEKQRIKDSIETARKNTEALKKDNNK